MQIGPKHPIRQTVLNLPTYFENKGCAVSALRAAFDAFDLDIVFGDMAGDDGRASWVIRQKNSACFVCDCCAEKMALAEFGNWLVITWYTMESGHVELVAYVS
jgi:hypothetical protein